MAVQRRVVVVTSLGKVYRGLVDIPSETYRTTDLFNSSTIYWKNPNEKCFDQGFLMREVELTIGGSAIRVKFDKIQIKLSEVIYFYDDQMKITDDKEKIRATSMVQKTREESQTVDIITRQVAFSFYHLSGTFFGLFKKKSNDNFIPLTDVKLIEIYCRGDKWFQKPVDLPHKFIGVSTKYIEAMRMK